MFADDNSAFSSPVNLGSFTAVPGEPANAGPMQVFSFTGTSAQFVRVQVDSNYGAFFGSGIGEVAFGAGSAAVPEPSTVILVGLAAMASAVVAWRRFRHNNETLPLAEQD